MEIKSESYKYNYKFEFPTKVVFPRDVCGNEPLFLVASHGKGEKVKVKG